MTDASTFFHTAYSKPSSKAGMNVRCERDEATHCDISIRHGNGYSTDVHLDLGEPVDSLERRRALLSVDTVERMLGLMFGFGIEEGKLQIRDAIGIPRKWGGR